jgi:hypothetical protein
MKGNNFEVRWKYFENLLKIIKQFYKHELNILNNSYKNLNKFLFMLKFLFNHFSNIIFISNILFGNLNQLFSHRENFSFIYFNIQLNCFIYFIF